MNWKCLLSNAGLGVNLEFIRDRQTWLILVFGLLLALAGGLMMRTAFPSAPVTGLAMVGLCLWQPLLEEVIFRGILQNALAEMFTRRAWLGLSLANLIQALLFGLSHLIHHPPLWALAVVMPGLALGYLAERHGHVAGAYLSHAAWNLAYFVAIPMFY